MVTRQTAAGYIGEGVDESLSETAMAAWVQFARSGDPGTPALAAAGLAAAVFGFFKKK